MNRVIRLAFCFLILVSVNIFAARLFYLSTDKTFSINEEKRVKIESEAYVSGLKIRVYKIVDPIKFYKEQDNIHKPVIEGRKLRYYTPEVVNGFIGFLKTELREWAREEIPTNSRGNLINSYSDFSMSSEETNIFPNKIVNVIKDPNFQLIDDFNYSIPEYTNNWNHNYIFLQNLQGGVYLIEGISSYNVAYTVLNVSDIGFILKKANDKVLVYATNNETGLEEKNIDLSFFDRFKRQIKTVKTDVNGIAQTPISDNEFFVFAKSLGGTYSFYDPKYYSTNTRDVYVYLYTDRPVYKGGDSVNLKGVIRSYKDDNYSIKTDNNIQVEIVDSMGSVVNTLMTKSDKDGMFFTNFSLNTDAPSGRYLMIATVGGKKFEGEFKLEYYKKPEFQVTVQPKQSVYIAGEKVNATIKATYYFGEPVKNGAVTYSIYRTKVDPEEWSKASDKSFYITEEEFKHSQMELLDTKSGNLNAMGNLEISFETIKDTSAYNYSIQAVVTNDTGIPISGSGFIKVVPADLKINIATDKFLYTINEKVTVNILTTDFANNPSPQKINVKISTTELNNDLYIFYDKEVSTNDKGLLDIDFIAEKNGFVHIEVYGKDKNGNETDNDKFLWIGEKNATFNYQGGIIKMVLDKKSYEVGDTAKLLIISPVPSVKLLWSVEGDSIYDYNAEQLDSNSLMLNIPIKSNYLPNVFVDVSFIFNNEVFSNSIKISVPPLEKFINIDIKPERNSFEPMTTGNAKIKVTDKNGKALTNTDVSIAIVDEAIYAISEEIAIDVYKYFYPFRRNNVASFSSIGFRFYGYSMDVNSELANRYYKDPTGLASFKGEEVKERKDFKDAILWLPSVKTDKNGEATFTINFPANITKWRITAIGITPDTKVGKSVSSVISRYDFFSDIILPNYLNEKDEAVVYSTTHSYAKSNLNASLTMSSGDFKIDGDKQNFMLNTDETKTLEWKINPNKTGDASLTLLSLADKYKDKVTKTIPVLANSILKTLAINKNVSSGDNKINFQLPDNIKKDGEEITVNLSFGFFSVMTDSIPYLIGYPYGCVEQTTSSFLPNLIAINTLNKLNIKMPEIEKKMPDIVNKGLAKLYSYQNPNGSFGWWNDSPEIDNFMTSYVMYALFLTKNLGYQVDQTVLDKGTTALVNNLSNMKNDTEKIYALYVLSQNNKKYPSFVQDLLKRTKNLSDYDMALLILTLYSYNMTSDTQKLGEELRGRAKKASDNQVYWGEVNTNYWYKDNIETTAWVVRALNKITSSSNIVNKALDWLFNKDDIVTNGVQYLLSQKQGSSWKSTRDTAAVIFAITDLISSQKFEMDNRKYPILLNNNKIGEIVFNRNNFNTELKLPFSTYGKFMKKDNELKIDGMDKEKLMANFAFKYYTNEINIKESSSGIKVERNYYKLEQYAAPDGTIRYKMGSKIAYVTKGENFIIEVKISPNTFYEYVMVEDYFPAGCLPVKDFLLYNIDKVKDVKQPDFTDFRDNRVAFFLTKTNGITLYYVVTPVFKGNYKVLPASASLMYFPNIRGNSTQIDFKIQ